MLHLPFRVIIIFAALSAIGFALLPRLSIQWLPTDRSPYLQVQLYWANASPTTLEQEVIAPLEGAFNLVQGIEEIYSIAGSGDGSIRLKIDKRAELEFVRFEIASKIRQLYPRLPEGVAFPTIRVYNPEEDDQNRPLLTYSLSGTDDISTLYQYANEVLSPTLALTNGLQSIDIRGGNEQEWRIAFDEERLTALGLQKRDLITAIQNEIDQESLGIAKMDSKQLPIRLAQTAAVSKEMLAELPIENVNRQLIRLKNVATISIADRPAQQFYRINGQNSIRLLFYAQNNTNTLRLAKAIKEDVQTAIASLPNDYQLRLEEDTTEYLAEELQKIGQRTVLSLSILLLFVLLVYRSWRYLAIVLLSLIANLGLALILYDLSNVELHLYALAGITVSFGIMIDNSIIMMHHLKHQGNLKVFPALLASTLTTIAALLIIWFLPDQWKVSLLDFAKVIGINLSVSLAVALFLIPALMQFVKIQEQKKKKFAQLRQQVRFNQHYARFLSFLIRRKALVVIAAILLFGLPVFQLPNQIEDEEWYNKTLGNEWYVEHIKPTVNKVLGGTLRLFVWYVYEGATYRAADETILHVQGSMPLGTTVAQMNEVMEQVERYLIQYDTEIKLFTTQVSDGQYGGLQITFNKGFDTYFPFQLKNRLTAYALNLGGVKWNIYGVGKGFSNASGGGPPRFRVMMKGYNKAQLARQTQRFADQLLVHPRIQEVDTEANINWWEKDLYEYELAIDKRRLAQQQIRPAQLVDVLSDFDQNIRSDIRLPNGTSLRSFPQRQIQNDLWTLENQLQDIDSTQLAFPTFTSLSKQKVSTNIHKKDQQYIQMVEFEYTGSARFGNQYLEEVMGIMEKEMPLGYSLEKSTYSFGDDRQKPYRYFLFIIVLIFAICAVMFESLRQAFNIVLLIPLSFIGIFLTFYWFDFPFDQGGYTSFLFVSGIVVNGLILIINDFNFFRKQQPNRPSLQLYIKAFNHKIVPILLTVISTSLGLIPFLLHGQQEVFWFSLAAGSIGGLIFSLLVVFVFTPIFFIKNA